MTNRPQTTAPVLSVSNLSIALPTSADRAYAVENVSLEVNPGEIVCVVGESGSGKSVSAFTVMGLLPKILRPSSGSVKLLGEELIGMSEQRLQQLRGNRMAMIFQEPMTALNPVKTVGDQIGEVFKWHGVKLSRSERDARVEKLMSDVHLPDVAHLRNSYPHELSGGQRQRVMIAMALAMAPALLIADEPTTALDVTTQAQILKLIRELQTKSSTGVLFITHDFGVVTDIADRVLVMRNGRVVEQGKASEVLNHPREAYTRMLLDAVPGIEPPPPRPLSQESAPILVIDKVSKRYAGRRKGLFGTAGRSVQALDNVSLDVRRGETLGIVGQSGSGKSTLARCIMRLVDTSDGSIRFDGREIQQLGAGPMRPFRRKIQMIFQDPYRSLNPRRTVGDSIIEGPLNYGASREEAWQDALRLLQLVGVPATAMERYPHQFSGGQRQRIAIARALAMKPDLLVADEAVSALDVSVQAQVLDLIESIREKLGLTILFVTHDLRVAARLCDSLAVMLNGKVVEYGRTAHVFANPSSDYTKALLAAAPGHLAHAQG